MNLKVIAILVVVLIIGAGGLLFLNQSKSLSPTASENPSGTNSLLDLINAGKTQKCTFSYTSNDKSETNGVVYIEGTSKMRGDIKLTASDKKETNFSMIRVGETTYLWGFEPKMGIKLSISAQELQTNTQVAQYLDTEYKTDYKCEAWTADESMFKEPADIKFTDLTGFIKDSVKTSSPSSSAQGDNCAICNSMTGQAKTYCVATYCQ